MRIKRLRGIAEPGPRKGLKFFFGRQSPAQVRRACPGGQAFTEDLGGRKVRRAKYAWPGPMMARSGPPLHLAGIIHCGDP